MLKTLKGNTRNGRQHRSVGECSVVEGWGKKRDREGASVCQMPYYQEPVKFPLCLAVWRSLDFGSPAKPTICCLHIFAILDYMHCVCTCWGLGLPDYTNIRAGLHFSHSEFRSLIYLACDSHPLQRKKVLRAGPSYKHMSPFCSLGFFLGKRCSSIGERIASP